MIADLLLHDGTVVTMDGARRVLTGSTVAIGGGRILDVGPADAVRAKHAAAKTIDCRRKVILPGLVDTHGYLSGSILKSIGDDLGQADRRGLTEGIIARQIDEAWWAVEAQLCALERLKLGTTCMFSMMGGNGTRTDDVAFARIAARELDAVGLRSRIGLGPSRPPWPQTFSTWREGQRVDRQVDFDQVIANCDTLLAEKPAGIVDYCCALSRIGNQNAHDPVWSPDKEQWVHRQAEAMRHLMARHDVGLFVHVYGNAIEYAHDAKLGLLGPRTILSHCTDISARAIAIVKETQSKPAHHPRAARMYSFPGRCPLPEFIDQGITVALGADVPANHDCDIFLDMKAAIALQRVEFRDPRLIPPGKALEMATIDGYRALGLDHVLGSIEPGKIADVITVDMFQPHLMPFDMPVHRLVYQANGRDVSDVVVDGRLVMEQRRFLTADEAAILERAQEMYELVVERANLKALARQTDRFWGASRS